MNIILEHGEKVQLWRDLAGNCRAGRCGWIVKRRIGKQLSFHPVGDGSKVFVIFDGDASSREVPIEDLAKHRIT